MHTTPYPPFHIKVPAGIVLASAHDGLIVTMARIVGLCWHEKHRWTPDYSMAELVDLLGRPQGTLYRHLKELERLGWLKVQRSDKGFVLHLLIPVSGRSEARPKRRSPDTRPGQPSGDGHRAELAQALRGAGIIGQPHNELLHHALSTTSVRAWTLWTLVDEQKWLKNPPGYLVIRLRAGVEPPPEFIRLTELTAAEMAQLRAAWSNSEESEDWPSLDEGLREIAPIWSSIYDRMSPEQRSSAIWGGSAAGP